MVEYTTRAMTTILRILEDGEALPRMEHTALLTQACEAIGHGLRALENEPSADNSGGPPHYAPSAPGHIASLAGFLFARLRQTLARDSITMQEREREAGVHLAMLSEFFERVQNVYIISF